MALGVGVHDGLWCAPARAGLVHSWANCGEGNGEVVDGPCKRCTRVSDLDGDKFPPRPIFPVGRDEGGVLLGLLCVFLVASEISDESNLRENECAEFFVEGGQAGVGCVRDASDVYEFRRCAVASLEESLCFLCW